MKKYCVYLLRRKDNNDIFYVGKGLKKRAYENRNRNEYCTRIIKKYGYFVEILQWFDNEKEAFELEIKTIKEIGIKNLTNITFGGEGCSGRLPTLEQRVKCSLSNKGKKPSNVSIERAKEVNSKEIGTNTGLIFKSITSAAEYIRKNTEYKKASKSAISACCNGYRVKTAYGIEWFFIENNIKINSGFEIKIRKTREVKTDCGLYFSSIEKAVYFLKENGKEKAQSTNIILSCKKENRKAYGYKWSYCDVNS